MKKIFTMMAVCAATLAMYTVSAGTLGHEGNPTYYAHRNFTLNSSRSITTCDTVTNVSLSLDTPSIFSWPSPGGGYASGNGAATDGTHTFPLTAIGEEYTTPSAGFNVTSAVVFFGFTTINAGDSGKVVTAYVYDTTGTGAFGGIAPGSPLDSASTTLKAIATAIKDTLPNLFTFTHAASIPSHHFFVTIALPQTVGDTIVALTNTGTTHIGNGWIKAPAAGGWVSYDSIFHAPQGDYIIVSFCKTNTGVESIDAGVSNFNLFPNPSNGVFTAALNLESASDVTISVMDVTGNKIYESTEVSVKAINKQINLSSAAAGLYFVNVKTATGSVNQRIVIK
jgi:hypothetical protein